MFSEIYAVAAASPILNGTEWPAIYKNLLQETSKSDAYQNFVTQKTRPADLASAVIGNLYLGSIFTGFLSALSHFHDENVAISNTKFGF